MDCVDCPDVLRLVFDACDLLSKEMLGMTCTYFSSFSRPGFYTKLILKGGYLEIAKEFLEDKLDNYHHELACSSNNLELVKWIESKGFKYGTLSFCKAITKGNFEITKHLMEVSHYWDIKYSPIAGRNGDLNVIKYLISQGMWNTYSSSATMKSGNIETVKFIVDNEMLPSSDIIRDVAYSDNVECIKYVVENIPDGKSLFDERLTVEIDFFRTFVMNFEILKYITENFPNRNLIESLFETCIQCGNTQSFEYLESKFDKPGPEIFESCNNVEMIKYLQQKGYKWNDGIADLFCECDDASGFIYFVENGSKYNKATDYSFSVEYYLISTGKIVLNPVDLDVSVKWYIAHCDLDQLKWIHENITKMDSEGIWMTLLENGKMDAVLHFFPNCSFGPIELNPLNINKFGYDAIKYLYNRGCYFGKSCYNTCVINGNLRIMKFIDDNESFQGNTDHIQIALLNGYFDILKYLYSKGIRHEYSKRNICDLSRLPVHVVKFLYSYKSNTADNNFCLFAAHAKNFGVVRWYLDTMIVPTKKFILSCYYNFDDNTNTHKYEKEYLTRLLK